MRILKCFCYVAVLSEMRVKEYLSANPQVLEDFIMADISQEQLERWLIRKTQALEPVTGDSNTGWYPYIRQYFKNRIGKKKFTISPGLPPCYYGMFVYRNVEFLETTVTEFHFVDFMFCFTVLCNCPKTLNSLIIIIVQIV